MKKLDFQRLLLFALLSEVFLFAFSYFHAEFALGETVRLAARYSGRMSLFFLLATFVSTSLNWRERRNSFKSRFINLIFIFSILHAIHFVFLGLNVYLNSIVLVPFKLAGGAIGYLLLLIYPWVLWKKNPPLWADYFYFHYLLVIMIFTILSRISGAFEGAKPSPFHYFGLVMTVLAILIHGIHLSKKST